MKLLQTFDDFLSSQVNINKSRLDTAKEHISGISSFLKSNDVFKDNIVDIITQGSYRHKTIIKPVEGDFDIDILVMLNKFEWWEPKDYITKLERQFLDSWVYWEKVKKSTRCVVIDYEWDSHVDVVPCLIDWDDYFILNKKENIKEVTDWEWYEEWFNAKNSITGWHLKKVVRLLKFVRDYQAEFDIKSVLLTTLIAKQVSEEWDIYVDLPSSFKLLVNRLANYLSPRYILEQDILENPVLPSENLWRNLTQEEYSNFRTQIIELSKKTNDAYEEEDNDASIIKWRKIFWDSFGELSDETEDKVLSLALWQLNYIQKLEDEGIFEILREEIEITAEVTGIWKPFETKSWTPVIEWQNLKFVINKPSMLIRWSEIRWQVVNTWDEAKRSNWLRGEFFKWRNLKSESTNNFENHESARYKWKHWIQCFAISNGYCVAKSKRFYVNIYNKPSKFRLLN